MEAGDTLISLLLLHLYSLPKKLRGQLGQQQGNQRKLRELRKGRALTPRGYWVERSHHRAAEVGKPFSGQPGP